MSDSTLTFPFVDLQVRLRPDRLHRLMRENRRSRQAPSRETIIREVADWLSRAHDATADKGAAGFYNLQTGWATTCPEATAAVIPTLLSLNEKNPKGDMAKRAVRLGTSQVLRDFAGPQRPSATVTSADATAAARAILGWIALSECFGDERFKIAALEAAHRFTDNQNNGFPRIAFPLSIQSLIGWAFLRLDRLWPDKLIRSVAMACIDKVVESISPDGYLHGCFHIDAADPALIRISQGLYGLLEAGILTEEHRWIDAAQRGARQLLNLYQSKGTLAGRYGPGWRANNSFNCMAGCSQTALLWLRLYQHGSPEEMCKAAVRVNRFVASTIDIANPDPGIRGGIRAGYPLWVDYHPLTYSALAAKLALDAFLLEKKLTGIQTPGHKLRFLKPAPREAI